MDRYKNYSQLSQNEIEDKTGNGDYLIKFKSDSKNKSILVLAPHGGKIEPLTSQIAEHIAKNDFNLYSFEGTKRKSNFSTLHITSTNFDEPICLDLLREATTSIAIHGKSGQGDKVLIGGLDNVLVKLVNNSLKASGFNSKIIESGNLSGTHKKNICNRTKMRKGVQVEIENGLRKAMKSDQNKLFNLFIGSIRGAIFNYLEK